MDDCPYKKIDSALDRFQEAHFWIHMMEEYYHAADPFRWHLNVFLKALKEVPDLLQMAMQNQEGFPSWFREQREQLISHSLTTVLSKKRNFVVHNAMLIPQSSGAIGITEGRGFKSGLTMPIHPLEDSEQALIRCALLLKDRDFLGLVTPDKDSVPCVYREWRLSEFNEELVDLCAKAWLRVGEIIDAVLRWQGAAPPELSLDCRHGSKKVCLKCYDRNVLIEQVKAAEKQGRDAMGG